ncbi:type II toxin-antitoxin system RelE/ParE family toxin [Petroclostridium sp. X23]|uniref:type II toxin-antitoxin system RelE/ParE family toxin n=1 Tax=Petroclostridium sp. X23 TaxID=3045146 RepID=UPI0024AD9F97|nr:type II toxin-antitoxin system RelE/ParE family toxin [Petroclostridium sp. X23]WHH59694.1 type II toxin-antitoxin system RelE/ParE family toxin [Petroclostridium sp. X23]
MYKLIISEFAHQDLDKIVSYIAVQLANPIAAGDFLDEVDKCYGHLKSNPMTYAKCQDKRLEKEGYRKALIKNYVLVYKINENIQIKCICLTFILSV